MITVSADELFDLVKSLSKSEKRFFKLTLSAHPNAIQLSKVFDQIEKSPITDALKNSKSTSKPSKQKNNVEEIYSIILKSQRAFFAESISGFQLKDEISNLKNLFDKAQYKQCRKMLNKLKEEAYKNEDFNFILEIISIEKHLLDIENKFGINFKSLDELILEEQTIIEKSKNIGEYTQAFSQLNFLVRQNMVVKTAKEFEEYDKMLKSALFKNCDKCYSKKAEVLYHHSRALCYSKKRDNLNRKFEFIEMKKLMDAYPFLISEYPKRYLSAINNILSAEIEQNNYGTAEKLIDEFVSLKDSPVFSPTDLQLKIFTSTSNAQLLIYTDGGKSEKAMPVVKYINEQINLYKDKINKEELLIFYYNFTNLFIYAGNSKEANKYLDLLLSANDTQLRQDLQCFSRIQNIILNYELKKTPQLKYILKTAQDFYKTQKSQFKTEKLIMSLFEEIITSDDEINIWKKYLHEFEEVMKDPYEKIANFYFDFLAYLNSKVTGEKIGDIIYKKQAANWKR